MSTSQQWLRTPAAAVALNCSQNYLKRNRESHGGPLKVGIHYVLGPSHSAAIVWNVEAVRQEWNRLGIMRLQMANQIISELQA